MRMRFAGTVAAVGVLVAGTAAPVAAAPAPALKAYTGIGPPVHLFGDTIHARLTVLSDPVVDPASLRVSALFAPYTPVGPPRLVTERTSPVGALTWIWTLRCLSAECLPSRAGKKSRVFRFPQAQIRHLRSDGAPDADLAVAWPRVEVLSRLGPAAAHDLVGRARYDWRYSVAPVAAPTFRIRPQSLFWVAISTAAALLAVALVLGARWCLEFDPDAAAASRSRGTPLARAISLLAWARMHGDETLQRKALERVGGELAVAQTTNGLSETARDLAWRAELPDDAEVEAFARRARQAESEVDG